MSSRARVRRGVRRWGFVLAAALVLGACTPPQTVDRPEVVEFRADPDVIVEGASSTLTWEVEGATSVVVTDEAGGVVVDTSVGSGLQEVVPDATTLYTLTASNAGGSTEATATVTVEPVGPDPEPSIESFVADPATIEEGDASTLSWTVSGASNVLVQDPADVIVAQTPGGGSVVVTPTATTQYTLTATGPGGTATGTVTVTVVEPGAPEILSFASTIVRGSQAQLSWTATNATSFSVLAVLDGDPSDTVTLATGVVGSTVTVPIPTSDRQRLRLVATGAIAPDDTAEVVLTNVVVSGGDYDPYDLQGIEPEPEVPGTLRSVLANAAPGSVVGFASDVSTVLLYGVDLENVGTVGSPAIVDAHLILRDDVVVSGPAGSPVTLEGVSGWEPGDPGDPFTYRSRVLFTMVGTEVLLENLVLTGGTFIFNGGAIRNDGDLTLDTVLVTGNRAWLGGGAIWNAPTGVLTVVDSQITDNRAVTEDDEIDAVFAIRGGSQITVTGNNGYGGGIYNRPGGVVTVTDSLIQNNEAKASGGAVYNDRSGAGVPGTLTLVRTVVEGNRADRNAYAANTLYGYGGGIYNGGIATLEDVDLLDNTVSDQGGGLYHGVESLSTLDGVFVAGNLAGTAPSIGYGGGIMHTFYTGEQGNLAFVDVSYGANNEPQDLLQNDVGIRGAAIGPAAVDGPVPGLYYLAPGIDPDLRHR